MSRKNEWNKLIFGALIQFVKAKSYFNNFVVVVVKNRQSFLGLGTLKSAVSQEPLDEMSWFFICWYKFRKAQSCFNNHKLGMVKNGWGFRDHCTPKSAVSHKWIYELSRLIEWFLVWLPISSAPLTFKCWGTTAVALSQIF